MKVPHYSAKVKWESLQNSRLNKVPGYTKELYYIQVSNTERLI